MGTGFFTAMGLGLDYVRAHGWCLCVLWHVGIPCDVLLEFACYSYSRRTVVALHL
jgi:hypothetical protein